MVALDFHLEKKSLNFMNFTSEKTVFNIAPMLLNLF